MKQADKDILTTKIDEAKQNIVNAEDRMKKAEIELIENRAVLKVLNQLIKSE